MSPQSFTPGPRVAALVACCALAAAAAPPDATAPGVPIQVHLGRPSTIPFDSPSGLVILTGRINGRSQVRLLLDTGDPSGFTLDTRTARRLGLDLDEKTPTRAAGVVGSQRYDLYRTRVDSFLLGGLSARDFSIWTAPDAALLARTIGTRVDGFVGVDLLRGLVVTIAYPRRQITFALPDTSPAGKTGEPAAVPMRLEGNRIVIEATLNGGETRSMILDTAAGTTFIAASDVALTRATPATRTTRIADSSGQVASVPVRILPSLTFGGVTEENVPVVPYDFDSLNRGLFAETPHNVAGILGSDVLSRHVLVLDFPNRSLRVLPPPERR
jgi:hypothetical protein